MRIELPVLNSRVVEVLRPSKIVCVGLNYKDHVAESPTYSNKGLGLPTEPVLFCKTPNVLIGPDQPIVLPRHIQPAPSVELRTDFEAELALVIGRRCRHLSPAEALSAVAYYTCFNDVSQRNIQKADPSGWFRGKSFDTFGPVGPLLVPAAALPDPQNLDILGRVNGVEKQRSNTRHMIFSLVDLLVYISRQFTLEPGDLISTGTPAGVAPLQPGDTVEVEIPGIGVLRNTVTAEE